MFLDTTNHLVAIWIDLVVDFVEEVGLWNKLDDSVKIDGNMGDILLITLEEVGINTAKYSLVGNDDDGVHLPLDPVNYRFEPTYQIQVALSAWVAILKLVLQATQMSFGVFLFDFGVG